VSALRDKDLQRDQDEDAALENKPAQRAWDGRYSSAFADGAAHGRKDLARRVLDLVRTSTYAYPDIRDLCQAIMKGEDA
jgi:hypothetical protein